MCRLYIFANITYAPCVSYEQTISAVVGHPNPNQVGFHCLSKISSLSFKLRGRIPFAPSIRKDHSLQ